MDTSRTVREGVDADICFNCGGMPGDELHVCPYEWELSDFTDDKLCNCCPECVRYCEDEI